MNVLDYRVSLDMFDTLSQITIKAKKGDSACRIHITLTEHGKIYKISEGCYATFNAKKADGNFIFDSCTIENNTIVYDFSSSVDENGACQVSAYEGIVDCEVTLYNADSKQLTSPRFTLFIDGTVYNGEEIVSSDELGAIEKLMEKPINKHNTDPDAHPEIKKIYVQSTEPKTAKVGDIWIDTSESEDESGDDASNGSGLEPVPGVDGFSPLVNVTAIDGGHTVTITDAEGTHTFTVMNGKDGASGIDGKDGKDGTDGVSVTHSWNGTVLTVTSASGSSSADLKGVKGDKGDTGEKGEQGIQGVQGIQGEKGDKGDKGDTGTSGYTPKKGTDYFTPADKAELVDDLIEETGIDIVPDYVIAEAESVIDRVIASQTGRVFTFAAISDMHYGNGSYTDGIKHACQALKYIDSRIKLDAVAVLGDYTDDFLSNNYDDAIEDFKGINNLLSDLRFAPNLRQQGNHDASYEEHYPLINRFIQAQSDDVIWGDKFAGYYYKDFDDYKLRIISLNLNEKSRIETPNKHGENASNGQIACSAQQYKWFISSLDLTSKDDASNWQILILSHQPLDWYSNHTLYFPKILNAYKQGTNISGTIDGTTVSGDFTQINEKTSAKLIGNIHGHVHNFLDDVLRLGNINAETLTDIKRISVPNACFGRENAESYPQYQEPTKYTKTQNSATDTAFCIYCVDLINKVINVIHYGAGYSKKVDYGNTNTSTKIYYSIANSLTNVLTNNSATSIEEGLSYTATLTASIEGDMSVTVTMGGEDVTSSVYANGLITISEVTGNIVITATVTAKEPTVTYTNQIPISIDTDGSVYNNVGYKEDYRINSSGVETAIPNAGVAQLTGFIRFKDGDTLRSSANMIGSNTGWQGIAFYDSNKNWLKTVNLEGLQNYSSRWTTNEDKSFVFNYVKEMLGYEDMTYIRCWFTGVANGVLTINEQIE